MSKKVSMVKNATSIECEEADASRVVQDIRNGAWCDEVKAIRDIYRKEIDQTGDSKRAGEAISELKRKLSGIMWSGLFHERKAEGLEVHSGLLVLDLDHLGSSLSKAKAALTSDPHVFACFISPSGQGLKAVYCVPPNAELHGTSWATAAKRVKSLTGFDPDASGKDVARLCFASFDPEVHHNPHSGELEIELPPVRIQKPEAGRGVAHAKMNVRRKIAEELLGQIQWQSDWKGFCDCPGKANHTSGDGNKDCRVSLDEAPTIYCFHESCRDDVERMNQQLRSRIGKEDPCRNESHNRDEMVFERLAKLTAAEYDRCREQEAQRLEIRCSTLDQEVGSRRQSQDDSMQGNTLKFDDPEPWHEPVDGKEALDEAAELINLHLVLPDGAADVMALWAAHAHLLDCFMISPRLNLFSPTKGCGKTTTLDVLSNLVPRPFAWVNPTPATLFRTVDQHHPTVLLDEVDTYLHNNDAIRGLLNQGHRRGGQVPRCEGDNHEVRVFNVFTPVALAGIGRLPGTLDDRSVVVPLAKAKRGEVKKMIVNGQMDGAKDVHAKLKRWGQDHTSALDACVPVLPKSAFNRVADNWRPLFAIAKVAGGDWPERAKRAYEALTAESDEQDIAVMLLEDIRTFLAVKLESDRIASADLAKELAEMEERPWSEYGRSQKPITPKQLAGLLKPFGINSRQIRFQETTRKGYYTDDFADAFDRYLAPPTESKRNSETTTENIDQNTLFETKQPTPMFRIENGDSVNKDKDCFAVSDEITGGVEVQNECSDNTLF